MVCTDITRCNDLIRISSDSETSLLHNFFDVHLSGRTARLPTGSRLLPCSARPQGGRWTIIRKLEWGPRSSTWLALDNNASILSYDAIKIFTMTATEDSESTGNNERYILLLDPVKGTSIYIPKLTSGFYEHDKASLSGFSRVRNFS